MQVHLQSGSGELQPPCKVIAPHDNQAHGAGDHLNPAAFPLFLDTYMYLLDGKHDCERLYPSLSLTDFW